MGQPVKLSDALVMEDGRSVVGRFINREFIVAETYSNVAVA